VALADRASTILKPIHGTPCSVGQLLTTLDAEDVKFLADVLADDRESRATLGPAPAAVSLIWPTPEPTENRLAVPYLVQAPPVSAFPHPLVAVRPKASCAIGPAGTTAVTACVTESVAPSLSVTVSTTL